MHKLAVLGLGLILWAQSLPESDCINAIPVCQQTYTYTNSPPDFGQTQELANNTCLLNNEQKTVWFIFTVQQSGTYWLHGQYQLRLRLCAVGYHQ